MSKLRITIWITMACVVLAGCAAPVSPTLVPSAVTAYPAAGGAAKPTSLPASTESAYPVDAAPVSPLPEGVKPLTIVKPVVAGATQVTGTGPAGVPIVLQDVTFMGANLSVTVVREDGTFVFELPPLERGHRIGVALGVLEGTRWKAEDFESPAYRGTEPMQVPSVGFYYDTAMVRDQP